MKKLFIASSLMSCFLLTQAQEETENLSTTDKIADKLSFVLDFTWDGWLDADRKDLNILGRSRGFSAGLVRNITFGKSNFGASVGLAITTNNIFNNAAIVSVNDTATSFAKYTNDTYDKNKLVLTYLDIPVEFSFTSRKSDGSSGFRGSVGGKIGYLIADHQKYVGKDLATGTTDVKYKTYDLNTLERLQYGVTLRIGFGSTSVYGYYGLNSVFQDDKGPEVAPFSLGISLRLP